MKETIKTVILFAIVLILALLVVNTKGDDPLNLDVDLNLSWPTVDEFNYPLDDSEYNGEFRNIKGNNTYILMGLNPDGTYRVYFVKASPVPMVHLKLDSLKLENDKLSFVNKQNSPLYITLGDKEVIVSPELGLGDASLEGIYRKMKTIDSFSMDEFELFNY